MARICEITRKKIPHLSNLDEKDPKSYQRVLLKRHIKIPEIKGGVNLKVSEEGLKLIKSSGGLAKFLKDQDDKKLNNRLLKLKRRIHGEPKEEKPEEAKETSAPSPEAPKPEPTKEEKKVEAKEEKPEEKPAEEKPAEKTPEDKKEDTAENKA